MKKIQKTIGYIVAGIACVVIVLLCVAPLLKDLAVLLGSLGLDSALRLAANAIDARFRDGLQVLVCGVWSMVGAVDSGELEDLARMAAYHYNQLSQATYDTLYMVVLSTFVAVILGLPLGMALSVTKRHRICSQPSLNALLGSVVNIVRSFPFIILIILLLPLSRAIVGTSIGASAAVIPLSIAAIPFIARLFEGAFEEIDKGLIEATLSMGASKLRIMRMMIAEAKPGLINATTITIIALIGYSAMGGAVGAGGLGDVAIRIGFQAYQEDILLTTSIVIILLVQFVQSFGDTLIAKARKIR